MAQISIRIDDTVKDQTDAILSELGLTISAAFNLFARQIIRHGGIPFPIQLSSQSPFDETIKSQAIAHGKAALRELRAEAEQRGFLSDEEIESEIQAYRTEKKSKYKDNK
jgi:addiction module RelB/DinJ family antitoxin